MSDLFTRSRTVILRNWRELSPKLAVGLLTGSVTGFALDVAEQNHLTINPTWQHLIVVGGFFLGGYIKSETFPTIEEVTRELPKAQALADQVIHPPKPNEHTQPVKVVPATTPAETPSFTKVIDPTPDEKPTEVLAPPYSRGQNFLDNLPSAQSNPLKDV